MERLSNCNQNFIVVLILSLILFQTVALVGESGCGKSTVISLLQRFYDPDAGRITLDGVEIQKLKLKWLRQQMGLVSQEPVLFNETIRANIAYGKEGNATEAEILAASELANAHKFISSLQQVRTPLKHYPVLTKTGSMHSHSNAKCRAMTQWLASVESNCQAGKSNE